MCFVFYLIDEPQEQSIFQPENDRNPKAGPNPKVDENFDPSQNIGKTNDNVLVKAALSLYCSFNVSVQFQVLQFFSMTFRASVYQLTQTSFQRS